MAAYLEWLKDVFVEAQVDYTPATAPTLEQAQATAYAAVDLIRFEGAHYRSDIAAKAVGHGPARE